MTRNRFSRDLSSFLRKNTSFQLLAISTILLGLNSCYNEPSTLGGGILPPGDNFIVQTDTSYDVEAFTVKNDSIPAKFFRNGTLGCVDNDIFGRVKADFVSQFYIYNLKDSLQYYPTRPKADSAFLILEMSKSWGNVNVPTNIYVYQLKDSISNSFYYKANDSIKKKMYFPTPINKPTVYNGEKVLKIVLTQKFADTLIKAPVKALTSNVEFARYLKGIYITSDELDGKIFFFGFANMRINLYFMKPQITGTKKTVFEYFPSFAYNQYNHQYDKAKTELKINHFYNNSNTPLRDTIQDTVFYVDGLGGVQGMISLKNFVKKWKEKMPIAINRATLILNPVNGESFESDSLIRYIKYYSKRMHSVYYSILDDDLLYLNDYYSFTKKNTVTRNKALEEYSFDITMHLQNILKGNLKEDYFYLEPTNYKTDYSQSIFRTGNNSKPIKLIVTYTKL